MAKGSFALWNCSVSLLRRKTWENFFPPVCQLQFPSPKFPAWLKYLNQLHLTAFSSIPSSWGKAQQPGKTHLPFLNFRAGLLCSCFLKSAAWDVAQHLLEFESAAPQVRVLILHPLCLAHKLHVVTSYCFKDKDCSRHLSWHLNYSSLGIIYSLAWVILLCWSTWLLLLTGKKKNTITCHFLCFNWDFVTFSSSWLGGTDNTLCWVLPSFEEVSFLSIGRCCQVLHSIFSDLAKLWISGGQ